MSGAYGRELVRSAAALRVRPNVSRNTCVRECGSQVHSSARVAEQRAQATAATPAAPARVPLDRAGVVPDVRPLPQTDGIHVATLSLKSHNTSVFDLDFFADFAMRAANALNIPTGGVAFLPTRTSLYTVPRGPFVHKKSQENFWRRTHHRCIKVYDASDAVVDRWLHFLRIHEMPGVASKAQVIRHYPRGVGQQLFAESAGGAVAPSTPGKSENDIVREMADDIVRLQLSEKSE